MRNRHHIMKPEFPIIELKFFGFLIFILGLTLRQILSGGEGYFIVFSLVGVGLVFGYFFTNYRNKKIEIKGIDLIVKPFLSKSKTFNTRNTQGYEIYETFDRTGLIQQIRLIDLKGKRIVFARDSYKDYDRLIQLIKGCGFKFLQNKEIKWRYKQHYGLIVSISFVLAMMMFFILKVIKNK